MRNHGRMAVTRGLVGVGLVAAWCSAAGAQAQPTAAEAESETLEAEGREMDRAAPAASEPTRAEAIAKEFNVESSAVQGMRNTGHGWGEITIQLAMAEHLAKRDPATYPTTAEALTRVDGLRRDGKGWGAISNELGFKLGPVISDVKRTHQTVRGSGRPDQPKPARAVKPDRPTRLDRPDRPGRPDRPEHPVRTGQ